MLQNITWTQFIVAIFCLTTLYYIGYLIKFRWHEFINRFNRESEIYENEQFNELQIQHQQDNHAFDELEKLINRIKTGILEKAEKKATKEEFLKMIYDRVASYDGLHQTAYRYALKNYIIQHSKALAGVEIEEEELEELWKDLPR